MQVSLNTLKIPVWGKVPSTDFQLYKMVRTQDRTTIQLPNSSSALIKSTVQESLRPITQSNLLLVQKQFEAHLGERKKYTN